MYNNSERSGYMPTVSTSIRLPQELYEWLKYTAEDEHRNISNMIIAILQDYRDGIERNTGKLKDLEAKYAESAHMNVVLIRELQELQKHID